MANAAGEAFVAILGFAGGLGVGSALVALLIVLDLIPRLAQLSYAYRKSIWFETAVVSGAVFWSLADFLEWRLWLPKSVTLAVIGSFDGIFVGMLGAALTEVMNVIPILAKRMRLSRYMVSLVMAMMLGKVTGSLFDWLVFQWMDDGGS
ncbi:stage V sporulation protein AB [Paenibacillus silvisoli]|uniref:stage V sporulation protein AB n=1 Tax=Paenibacillus silvisoli TaxID=3110539 RepID=UPI00389959BF